MKTKWSDDGVECRPTGRALWNLHYAQALAALRGLTPAHRARLGLSDIRRAAIIEANQLVARERKYEK